MKHQLLRTGFKKLLFHGSIAQYIIFLLQVYSEIKSESYDWKVTIGLSNKNVDC